MDPARGVEENPEKRTRWRFAGRYEMKHQADFNPSAGLRCLTVLKGGVLILGIPVLAQYNYPLPSFVAGRLADSGLEGLVKDWTMEYR